MGSRMAANLLKAGHTVTVWNRSPEAEEALVASGARRASSPKAHSRRVSLRNDKKAWLVGRRIRNGRSSAAIQPNFTVPTQTKSLSERRSRLSATESLSQPNLASTMIGFDNEKGGLILNSRPEHIRK